MVANVAAGAAKMALASNIIVRAYSGRRNTNATSYSASMGGSSFDGSDVSFVFEWEYETWFVCLV